MMRRTHAAAGLALGLGFGAYYAAPLPETLVFAVITEIAALLPDLDLKLKIKHRTVTHSLLALLVVALLARHIDGGNPEMFHRSVSFAFVLGYASHLLLDMLTVSGIELLYPWHYRVKVARLRTNGRIDHLIALVALCASLGALISTLQV